MSKTSKPKRKGLKMFVFILLGIILVLIVAAAIYFYKCSHYWQSDMKKRLFPDIPPADFLLPMLLLTGGKMLSVLFWKTRLFFQQNRIISKNHLLIGIHTKICMNIPPVNRRNAGRHII